MSKIEEGNVLNMDIMELVIKNSGELPMERDHFELVYFRIDDK